MGFSAITRLLEVFPDRDYRNRAAWREYLSHALYALSADNVEKDLNDWEGLAWKAGMCLYSDGRYKEAGELFVQVMETRKRVLARSIQTRWLA
jgi:hypothetical protein